MKNLIKKINKCIDLEKWDKARGYIKLALSKEPDNHWLLVTLALTYYEQHNYKKSLMIEKQALKLAPKCPLVLWDYAGSLDMLGRTKDALKIYNGLVRRGPYSIAYGDCGEGIRRARSLVNDCFYKMAKCYEDIGQKSKALKPYEKYIHNREYGKRRIYSIYSLKKVRLEYQTLRNELKNRK